MNATQWALLAIWPLGMILAGIVPQLAHVGTSLWWVGVGAGVVGGGLAAVDAAHSVLPGPGGRPALLVCSRSLGDWQQVRSWA